MKLISWNVNGIRSVIKKGFVDFVHSYKPDVLCLQETKASQADANITIEGYHQYWNAAEKAGYAGTAVFSQIEPVHVAYGMGIAKHDHEGRVITLEYPKFYLVNVYVPNSQRQLERLDYRTKEWDPDFLQYLKNLEKKKPVVFCGDLNVAHKEIDLANPKGNVHSHGFTPEERAEFDKVIANGFIDSLRALHQEAGLYTWWTPMNNCRQRNIGWRIDYFCLSAVLRPHLKEAFILKEVEGSDHCPIGIELENW